MIPRWTLRACVALATLLVGACVATPATVAPSSIPPTAGPSAEASTPPASGGPPRHVVIDTDMAADDWLAILFLLGRADVEVVAITVTGTGEAHCEPGVRNALALAALAGEPDIPVACGGEEPLAGNHAFPDAWREGVDGLFGIPLPEPSQAPHDGTAIDLLLESVLDSAEPVTLLTLGPLTNVARAVERTPALIEAVEQVYIMGGAVGVGGNVGISVGIDNRFAEWNIYCDPVAAKLVLESGLPNVLVPLDATNRAPVTPAFVDRLAERAASAEARFTADALGALRRSIENGGYFFWDPLAAALVVDESLATFETASLSVVTDEGPDSGRVVVLETGPVSRYAVSADPSAFEELFLEALNAPAR